MIRIDGCEGGGQILRSSIALSAIEKEPIKIVNIRGSRENPGLKEQHLKGLRGLSEISNGKLIGDEKGSEEIEFYPGRSMKEETEVKINTAGSIGLVLQQFLILGLKEGFKLKVEGGGTYVKWAPPVDYIREVCLPLMNRFSYKAKIGKVREGFYPRGGGRVSLEVKKRKLDPIKITKKGSLKSIHILSKASSDLKERKVAERQAEEAKKEIKKELSITPNVEYKYVDSLCPGSGILIKAETDKTIFGADALGERGKRSEEVGKEASRELIREIKSVGTVDVHMADQLIPYIGYIDGESVIRVRELTNHIQTNIKVTEEILGTKFKVDGNEIRCKGKGQRGSE